MSAWLRYLARRGAYAIALLLAAVWCVAAMESLTRPLYDIGKPLVGNVLVSIFDKLPIAAETVLVFALMLVGLKLMVGMLLLASVFTAAYEKHMFGSTDDAMLDVALLVAALASVASAPPAYVYGGHFLLEVIGELMLCAIASALAIYGRGYVTRDERPRPVRPFETGVIQTTNA
jgi:hypothetical protein